MSQPYRPTRPGALPPEFAVRRTSAEITLIVKSACVVCERARRTLEHSVRRYRLKLEVVNVQDRHPELYRKWENDLPIVLIDGKRRFSGHIDGTRIEQALQKRSFL